MSKFEVKFWQKVGARLKEIRAGRPTAQFLIARGLSPRIPWNSVEVGTRGLDVQTVVMICKQVDIAPTYLLLGEGEPSLTLSLHPKKAARLEVEQKALVTSILQTLNSVNRDIMIGILGEVLGNDFLSSEITKTAAPHGPGAVKSPRGQTKRGSGTPRGRKPGRGD